MKFTAMTVLFLVMLAAAAAHCQPFAYVANSGTRNLSVIDTADDSVISIIPLPDILPNVHPNLTA